MTETNNFPTRLSANNVRHFFNRFVFVATGVAMAAMVGAPDIVSRASLLGYSITAYLTAGFAVLFIVGFLVNFTSRLRERKISFESNPTPQYHKRNALLGVASLTAIAFGLFQVIRSFGSLDEPKALQAVVAIWLLLAGIGYFATVNGHLNQLVLVLIGSGAVSAVLIISDSVLSWDVVGSRHSAMYLLVPLILSLGRVSYPPIQWALSLGMFSAIAVTASRTATVTALIIFLAYLALMRRPRLAQRIQLSALAFALFGAFLLLNPTVQDRFLGELGDRAVVFSVPGILSESDTEGPSPADTEVALMAEGGKETATTPPPVSDEGLTITLNTNGRFNVWGALAERVVYDHPFVGGGAGYAREFVSDRYGWRHPHNEFLRVFADYGAIGLGLMLVSIVTLGSGILETVRDRSQKFIGASALLSIFLMALTDLPLVSFGLLLPTALTIAIALMDSVKPTWGIQIERSTK